MLIYAVYFLAVIADCYPWMHLVVSWPWTWPFCTFLKCGCQSVSSAEQRCSVPHGLKPIQVPFVWDLLSDLPRELMGWYVVVIS
jgi:hypothetical protein